MDMPTETNVWIGLDIGKADHFADVLDDEGSSLFAGGVANDEPAIAALLDRAASFGLPALVVDQAGSLAQLVITVAARHGVPVAYVPGLVMRRAADLYPGEAKTDRRDAFVLADFGRTAAAALGAALTGLPPARVVLEAGPRSPWLSRVVAGLGHEVVVANPRQVALIARNQRKTDRLDAAWLARLGRFDPELLAPIRHRSEQSQHDLAVVRGRDALVRSRTLLINHVRGAVKACGAALPSCTAEAFHRKVAGQIPDGLRPALLPLVEAIGELTARIAAAGREVEALCGAEQAVGDGAHRAIDPAEHGVGQLVGHLEDGEVGQLLQGLIAEYMIRLPSCSGTPLARRARVSTPPEAARSQRLSSAPSPLPMR